MGEVGFGSRWWVVGWELGLGIPGGVGNVVQSGKVVVRCGQAVWVRVL